ncbi:BMP family protein [Phytoactinopolyspora endophytica]|uniref:BMP family protein n=1 Tax=Phytoactinopolyspora endophytica TaxID=1642495 RepID=UPI00101D4BF2|nr:BMP family protein [Phytoactinopolyspora endophytica]
MADTSVARRTRTAALAAIAVSIALSSCGDDGRRDGSATEADGGETTASEGDDGGDAAPKLAVVYYPEFRDGSWGEAALKAGEKLESEGVISEFASQENVQPGADAIRALEDFAEQGYSPIIAHSFNYGDDVKEVAAKYPDTLFVYAGGFGDVDGNVGDYAQPFHEATYLEGILAAGAIDDGNVAGAGGFDIPVCRAMYNSFLEGVQELRPETTGSFVEVGSWEDIQLAKETALSQADSGATMFVGCGQGPTFGQIEAADERGLTAFGYTGDMSERSDAVVASFTWNLDAPFRLMVEDVAAGNGSEARYYDVGMADDAMDVVISPTWESEISADVMELFEERLTEIKDGSLTIEFVSE